MSTKPSTLLSPGQPDPRMDPAFKSGSFPAVTTFGFNSIGPPSPLYIQRDDVLAVDAVSDTLTEIVTVNGRLLLAPFPRLGQPDQASGRETAATSVGSNIIDPILLSVNTGGVARNSARAVAPLSEGYLLSLSVTCLNATQRGQTYVRVFILRGATNQSQRNTYHLLFKGYVTSADAIGWPYGRTVDQSEGLGALKSVQVTNPAPGADWTFTVPGGVRDRVQSLAAVLTTSAAVASRNVRLFVDDGANNVWATDASASVLAGVTQTFAATGTNVPIGVVTTIQNLVLPPGLFLPVGWRVRTVTGNIDGGDQWSAIFLAVEQLLEGL